METSADPITVETRIRAALSKVWRCWITPEHIMQWNAASDDWHCPAATNDLRVGGSFTYRMAAKDGSMAFDLAGTYTDVEPESLIEYRLGDGPGAREVKISFEIAGDETVVRETFTPESTHPLERQRAGWQSILDRFKAHVEATAV